MIDLAIVDFPKIALKDIYLAQRPDSEKKHNISSSKGKHEFFGDVRLTRCYFYPIYCLSYILK